MFLQLLFILVLWLAATSSKTLTMPGCQEKCGDVEVPYPFGIGSPSCYIKDGFGIDCKDEKPTISGTEIPVLEISLRGTTRITYYPSFNCYNLAGPFNSWFDLRGSPYRFSYTVNMFTAIGCNTVGVLKGTKGVDYTTGCVSLCRDDASVVEGSCSGVGCCQTSIPMGIRAFNTSVTDYNASETGTRSFSPCSYAFLVDQESFKFSKSKFFDFENNERVPLVLDWAIGTETCEEAQKNLTSYACDRNSYCSNSTNGFGYLCNCSEGYEGNPYLPDGCQDIDECVHQDKNECFQICPGPGTDQCEKICNNTVGNYTCSCPDGYHGDGRKGGNGVNGVTGCTPNDKKGHELINIFLGVGFGFLALLAVISWLYWGLQKRRLIKLKQIFFEQNGGLLLQQKISQHGSSEIFKIFTTEELKRATNNFDEGNILGRGGHGTVYKGILPDKNIVAIKKSHIVDKTQIEEFTNEIFILSYVNHRNVVKILGCCLETEAPMLVYEYISNGTLFDHIHKEGHRPSISWEMRLRIAAETAAALDYLHSAATPPILHRDIKSTNILLDDYYTAKLSDFGASKSIPFEKTHVITLVQGTLGYLDPEYLQTGQLTDKSDVYSFGVVLVELLTGEKQIFSNKSEENISLATYFISSIKENRVLRVLEERVANEGGPEQLLTVAELAGRCLQVNGADRPTMKEVAMELEGLRNFQEHPWLKANQNREETESFLGEQSHQSNTTITGQDSSGGHMILPLEIAR